MKKIIEQKIQNAFSPEILKVIDESDLHRGHGGWREGGNTHFKVQIKASMLDGKNRVGKHQAIMKLLADEFNTTLHALSIEFIS